MVTSFAQLIAEWPRDWGLTAIGTLAADLGVPYLNVQMMKFRNSIPSAYWPKVVAAARRRGMEHSTLQLMVQLQMRSKHGKHRRSKRARVARPRRRAEAREAA
jgi:hypothetical protein